MHRAVDQHDQVTDKAPTLVRVMDELIPAAIPNTGQRESDRREANHGRPKANLEPMHGLKTNRTASVVIQGHAFIQDVRRGHDELSVEVSPAFRLAAEFDELQLAT